MLCGGIYLGKHSVSFDKFAMDEKMSIDNKEDFREQREGTEDSMDSHTPDAEAGAPNQDQDGQPPAKRKGGRKPVREICTTYSRTLILTLVDIRHV